MKQATPKSPNQRSRETGNRAGGAERNAERRPRERGPLEGDFERDAGARRELEELERAEREQRRMLEGRPAPGRPDAEE